MHDSSVIMQFHFATGLDWFLMVLGSLMAFLHGFVLPIALLLLAFIADAFAFHDVSRFTANNRVEVPFQYLLSLQSNRAPGADANQGLIEINMQILSGGIVNCSKVYTHTLPPPFPGVFQFTIGDLIRSATVPTAVCYDNISFTNYITNLIIGMLVVIVTVAVLGAFQMLIFHLTSERQMGKMRVNYFQSILRQERKWHDLHTQGELSLHLSE